MALVEEELKEDLKRLPLEGTPAPYYRYLPALGALIVVIVIAVVYVAPWVYDDADAFDVTVLADETKYILYKGSLYRHPSRPDMYNDIGGGRLLLRRIAVTANHTIYGLNKQGRLVEFRMSNVSNSFVSRVVSTKYSLLNIDAADEDVWACDGVTPNQLFTYHHDRLETNEFVPSVFDTTVAGYWNPAEKRVVVQDIALLSNTAILSASAFYTSNMKYHAVVLSTDGELHLVFEDLNKDNAAKKSVWRSYVMSTNLKEVMPTPTSSLRGKKNKLVSCSTGGYLLAVIDDAGNVWTCKINHLSPSPETKYVFDKLPATKSFVLARAAIADKLKGIMFGMDKSGTLLRYEPEPTSLRGFNPQPSARFLPYRPT